MATAACARVLGAVEEERTAASEFRVRVRWVAEEERTASTLISARVHGAAASRGGAAVGWRPGGDLRSRPCGSKGENLGGQRENYGIEILYPR